MEHLDETNDEYDSQFVSLIIFGCGYPQKPILKMFFID